MGHTPAIIVKKGGFLSALATGFFGFLTVCVICASGLGGYAMLTADRNLGRVLKSLPELWEGLPPAVADAFHDRRAIDYQPLMEVSARCVMDVRQKNNAVIEIHNRGDKTVTMLSLRVVLEDANGVPQEEFVTYAASPFALAHEHDLRGPLLPGQSRRIARPLRMLAGLTAQVEITDIRVWEPIERPALRESHADASSPATGSAAHRGDRDDQ